ncbi:MAG: cobalt-precorrin-5B (C(1))-methyltransferase, partial [Nitrospirae bacterium]|nr:cobalt-precorrin-5B (C(1))-methyltransferase [Nitrospirota bacterium]
IKDAGDDPDVTNGAEIVAEVRNIREDKKIRGCEDEKKTNDTKLSTYIKGGKGVGIVTKPGLAIPIGEPAINSVPRKMIKEAVLEAVQEFKGSKANSSFILHPSSFEVTISVVNGENLAKKTLNSRLGIIGGISILGTTGIVKPVSSEAWTATITSSMDVAKAMGHREIVLSAGRTSEKAHMKKFNLPEECYVMMGDYLEFSLLEAKKHGFKKIHLCAQWAKMLKIAMATPQTHVRHGAIDVENAVEFLKQLDSECWILNSKFNTAREIFDCINSSFILHPSSVFSKVCSAAKKYAEGITGGVFVIGHLVSYEGEVIISCD